MSIAAAPAPAPVPVTRPRVARVVDGAVVGGVANGIAVHTGWNLTRVRLAFAVLGLFGGFGVVLYAAYWIVLPSAPAPANGAPEGSAAGGAAPPATVPATRRFRQIAGIIVIVVVLLGLLARSSSFLVPAALACLGAAFLWRQADDGRRHSAGRTVEGWGPGSSNADRRRSWTERSREVVTAAPGDRAGRARLVVGAGLVLVAVITALLRTDVSSLGNTVVAVLVAVVGIGLLTGPWWIRLIGELGDERRERIRSEERAELAARVHDSVLQTLALIQRRADSPREVARLARGQERELRTLLWGADPHAPATLVAALRAGAAEVEDGYAVAVDVVAVGDSPVGPAGLALVSAAREAMLNAAKHAGVDQIALFAEIDDDTAVVFVRDRGRGFDPTDVAADRQGLRRSVTERMARHGGRSEIHSAPGEGTEVELEMRLR